MKINHIYQGDCLEVLKTFPDECVDCVITSPPYWGLRDYGVDGQLGLEKTPEEYVSKLVLIYREVKRVLKKEGTCWLNLGDSYMSGGGASRHWGYTDPKYKNGRKVEHFEPTAFPHKTIKPKDLVGIPWRVAFALQADGWWLRQDIIWHKPNPMPESVTDRCTKSHEYIFLLTKSSKYYFDNEIIKEPQSDNPNSIARRNSTPRSMAIKYKSKPFGVKEYPKENYILPNGRNKRSVWTITTQPYPEAHFATFPKNLIKPMIKAGCPKGGVVLDHFIGSGTTALVARELQRNFIGIELNSEYIKLCHKRLAQKFIWE